MGSPLSESVELFNNAMANRRKLIQDQRHFQDEKALKIAGLQSKGINIGYQDQPQRKLFGFIPQAPQRSLRMTYDPTMNPDYQTKVLQQKKLGLENQKLERQMGENSGSPQPGYFLDPTTGHLKSDKNYIGPKQERQFNQQSLGRATELRKEFNSAKATKDYDEIMRATSGLEEAYKLATSPDGSSRLGSDQALGVLFQKMLDPNSVVRESEYARTPEGAALMSKIQGFAPQLQRGGLRLGDQDRLALIEMARKIYGSSGDLYNRQYDRYSNIAKDYEVDPDLFFGGIKRFERGGGNQDYSDLDQEAQAAIAAGADPNMVRQRFSQIRGGNGRV